MMILSWEDTSGETQYVRFDVVTKEAISSVLGITGHPVEDGEDVVDDANLEPKKISIEGYVSNAPLPDNPGINAFSVRIDKNMSLEAAVIPLSLEYRNQEFPGSTPIAGGDRTVMIDYTRAGEPDSTFPVSPGALTKVVTGAVSAIFGKPAPRPTSFQGYSGLMISPLPKQAAVFKGVDGYRNRARAMYEKLEQAQRENARINVSVSLTTIKSMMIANLSATRAQNDGSGATFSLELQHVRIVKTATVDAPKPTEKRAEKKVKAVKTKTPEAAPEAKEPGRSAALSALSGTVGFLRYVGMIGQGDFATFLGKPL